MKKSLQASLFIILFHLSSTAQITGSNHYQTYGSSTMQWSHIKDNTFFAKGTTQNETVLFSIDLDDFSTTYLNDSTIKNLNFYVLGDDTGYATSSNFKTYHTYDGWETITENASSEQPISGVTKVRNGYIGYKSANSTVSDIYFSKDLKTWTKKTDISKTSAAPLNVVETQGRLTVFSRLDRTIVSYDGGETFKVKNYSRAPQKFINELIVMEDTTNILARVNATWMLTKDGGAQWEEIALPLFYSVFYANKMDSIYARGSNDSIFLTQDTGKTWSYIANIPSTLETIRVRKTGDYFTQYSTKFHYSKNLTEGWKQLPLNNRGNRCVDAKGNFVLAGGTDGSYSYSTNGGKTFESGTIANTEDMYTCKVINDTIMLMADFKGNVYRSTDQGISWEKRTNNIQNNYGIKFTASADYSVIVLTRWAGQPLLSTDYGTSWSTFVTMSGGFDFEVLPNGKIYAAVNKYTSATESNISIEEVSSAGARTEVKIFTESNLGVVGLKMIDDNIGYCFGSTVVDGKAETQVFKTTDGWKTYTNPGKIDGVSQPSGIVLNFHIPNKDTLYLHVRDRTNTSTTSNNIYYSYNGGATWNLQNIITNKFASPDKLQGLSFYNGKQFISVWQFGRIFLNNKIDADTSTTLSLSETNVKNNHIVAYPNPFTHQLTISSTSSILEVQLLDYSGKVILTQTPLLAEHTIDLSKVASGFYFIRATTTEGNQVLRVIKN